MGPNTARENEIHSEEEEFLFSPQVLDQLDWSKIKPLKNGPTSHNPGNSLKCRPLSKSDYDKGFPKILSQLTVAGDVTRESFEARFDLMKNCLNHYYITVIEDLNTGKIAASATLAVELKFIRSCAKRGRLEDVVVDSNYRGKQLGKLIVSTIILIAREIGCYKITLDCKDAMRDFYTSLGFSSEPKNDKTMAIRF